MRVCKEGDNHTADRDVVLAGVYCHKPGDTEVLWSLGQNGQRRRRVGEERVLHVLERPTARGEEVVGWRARCGEVLERD